MSYPVPVTGLVMLYCIVLVNFLAVITSYNGSHSQSKNGLIFPHFITIFPKIQKKSENFVTILLK